MFYETILNNLQAFFHLFSHLNSFFPQILFGLEYSHSMGIVHRDLKQHYILIRHDYKIKLIDLGLSSMPGQVLCITWAYKAPEMFVMGKQYDVYYTNGIDILLDQTREVTADINCNILIDYSSYNFKIYVPVGSHKWYITIIT